jgi:hypothetical protein
MYLQFHLYSESFAVMASEIFASALAVASVPEMAPKTVGKVALDGTVT